MTDSVVIGKLAKSPYVEIRVTISEFEGDSYVHIRQYVKDKKTGKFTPTQKGVAVREDQALELCGLIEKLRDELEERQQGDVGF